MRNKKTVSYISRITFPEFPVWTGAADKRIPFGFDMEITARCNLNCRHCYINLPARDLKARNKELTVAEIERIAGEAAGLGAVWCLITGGEPLLRQDFAEIYMVLKKKGLLLSVFTNATLVREEHVRLFREYPPRDVEVTVYGVTRATYERITRVPGSFDAFMNGLNLLMAGGIKVRLKAMAMRSNLHELDEIAAFCRSKTKDFFRFDPFLNYRLDRNQSRNAEIESERLAPEEIAALEKKDPERFEGMKKYRDELIFPGRVEWPNRRLFHCGVGRRNFYIGWDGKYRPCLPLVHPDFLYDLRRGNLAEAWNDFTPRVLSREARSAVFLEKCGSCPIVNLCMWCPALAYLETGDLEGYVDYFCRVAKARAANLEGSLKNIDKKQAKGLK